MSSQMSSSMLDWFLSTLTPTPSAETHMPSTAEIIQKCLNINPFDMKFREANLQISGQTPEQIAAEQQRTGGQITTPGIMLKLPSSSNQSPNVLSNVLSAAEIENELRRNIEITSRLQRFAQNNLIKQEGNRTPCTADVLNAVLDMNMNQAIQINSTSSLVAGLSAAAANTTASTSAITATSSAIPSVVESSAASSASATTTSTVAPTAINVAPGVSCANGLLATSMGDPNSMDTRGPTLGGGFTATSAAALLQQQQQSIANMISSQQQQMSLNALNGPQPTTTNQSMPNLHSAVGFQANSSAPASNGLMAPRASPALSGLSPRSTSNIMDLNKANSVADSHRAASVDPYAAETKPLINKSIPSYSMYESSHGRLELKTDSFAGMSIAASSGADSTSSSQPNSHLSTTESLTKPHRKYARYHNPNSDGQPATGRGGRGRRSITSEMPPDERRMTILERNKAAAVRYRKRKKEEHDEMITRVQSLEEDKVFLQTQNAVYKREIDRLTELLKARDARCICRAGEGLPIFPPGHDLSVPGDPASADSNYSKKFLGQQQHGGSPSNEGLQPSTSSSNGHLNGNKHSLMMQN